MKNNRAAENIVQLDEEVDRFSNVNILKPETLAKKQKGSKSNKNFPLRTYIYIDDDDDDDDESSVNYYAGTNIKVKSKSNDAAKHSPVKLSKGNRTYPAKGPNNDNVSESELKVDSKGMLEKLWERASLKKKACVQSEFDSSKEVFKENKRQCGFGHNDENSKHTLQIVKAQQLQNTLKRKEAEESRLLNVERRQKQRVEEIRETQKKDEENMKLKEIYRTKVQQDLKMLEMTCHDMASLLSRLGILVDNSPFPLPNQIHAAYKRALLWFHPDRASGSDMQQQVEAEEKFKLISRMKDQFL